MMSNPDNEVPQLISSGGFHHDHIRCLIILWSQHNYYRAYSEPPGYNKYKPDLVLRRKGKKSGKAPIIYIEIQKDDNDRWREKKQKQYKGKHLVTVQPRNFPEDITPWELYYLISERMEIESDAPIKKKDPTIKKCEGCGKPKKENKLYKELCRKCRYEKKRREHSVQQDH